MNLSRIILFAQDVDVLKNFYQQHFHLQITEETAGEWVVFKTGSAELALHKIGPGSTPVDPKNKPLSSTKLVFETNENLYALSEKLLSAHVAVGEVKSFAGYPYLFCDGTDPEGNVFQLMGKV